MALLVPLSVVASVFISWLISPEAFHLWVTSPTSVLEATTGIVLLAAFACSVWLLTRSPVRAQKQVWLWLFLFAAGVLFFVGEDQNWGQYYLGLEVPEYFMAHNKEQEMNLHNMSSWFNQKPRAMVELWVLVIGIIVPLGWEWPKRVTAKMLPSVFWIGRELLGIAVLGLVIGWTDRVAKLAGWSIADDTGIRFSEIQEFCYAWFMLMYIRLIGKKLMAEVSVR